MLGTWAMYMEVTHETITCWTLRKSGRRTESVRANGYYMGTAEGIEQAQQQEDAHQAQEI